MREKRDEKQDSTEIMEKYRLSINYYMYGTVLAINVLVKDENLYEPWGCLTTNLLVPCALNAAYLDTNNNPNVVEELLRHNMGKLTGRVMEKGFCKYPEFLFDSAKLAKADPDGYAKYLAQQGDDTEMTLVYGTCIHCGKTYSFSVKWEQAERYYRYLEGSGEFIQDIFPEMDHADREVLRSNSYCRQCWKELFGAANDNDSGIFF